MGGVDLFQPAAEEISNSKRFPVKILMDLKCLQSLPKIDSNADAVDTFDPTPLNLQDVKALLL